MPAKMDDVREVKLKRSDSIGLGFSVFGGKGSEFPPVIYQVVDESPAAVCGVLEAGDIILEVNDKQVVSLTTKEVLKCLRLSNDVVRLKVKKDARIKERVHHHMAASNELEALRRSHVKENSAPTNGHHPALPLKTPQQQPNGDLRENGENIPPKGDSKPKFETFMMTGELIIKTKSITNSASPKKPAFKPQEALTSSTKSNKIDEDVNGRENPSHNKQHQHQPENAPRPPAPHSPVQEKKGTLSYGGNFVRTSRSEDYLQKSSVSTVNIDIEEEEEDTATSLNNLLDTAPEVTYNDTRTGQFIHITNGSDKSMITIRNSQQRAPSRTVHNKDGVTIDENKIYIDVKSEASQEDGSPNPLTISSEGVVKRSCSPEDESDVESLSSFHYSPKAIDMPSASRLAKRLFNLEGFKKSDVSLHLCKNRVVAEEYLKFFNFHGDTLDVALRKFLKQFSLIGETQERERVLVHFSKRYLDCNPGAFKSQDAVHTLTCALMLLNSDLHRENASRRMSCAEFVENLAELNEGENFSKEVLKALYHSIKSAAIVWAVDDDEEEEKPSEEKSSSQSDTRQNFIGHNPFLEVPNPNFATEYKKGYVMRKCCVDPNGKKTPIGKRGWKMFYADLRDLVLYLHKDENGFRKNQLYDSLHNSIRIHHAIATRATDYTKKQHVFRLQTADQAVYLFQTRYYRKDRNGDDDDKQQDDSKELQSWIDTINYVAACLSAPSLAEACGAQKKFQRPLLPVAPTKLNFREQLLDLESKVMRLEKEIEEHLSHPPERSAKSRVVSEYVEKEHFLQYELKRYRTYIYLLRSKVAQFPELEPPLVETSIGEVDENLEKNDQPNTVPTSISEPACTTEKRRFSDRFSYRAAIYKTDPTDNGA